MITDAVCFLENNILQRVHLGRKKLQMVDKSIRHLMTSPFKTVYFQGGGGGGGSKNPENYRSYNTSPGFDVALIFIIIIMKFAHHIKKSRQHVI